MISRVRAAGGTVSNGPKFIEIPSITIKPGNTPHPVSVVRRLFGDDSVTQISVPHTFPDSDEKRILDLFPEAEVVKFWPASPDDPRVSKLKSE